MTLRSLVSSLARRDCIFARSKSCCCAAMVVNHTKRTTTVQLIVVVVVGIFPNKKKTSQLVGNKFYLGHDTKMALHIL